MLRNVPHSRRGLGRALRAAAAGLALALALGAGAARADAVQDGDRALKAGNLDAALRSYEVAARSGSAAGEAGVGKVRLRQGRYAEAMEAFRRAQKADPTLAAAYFGQAEVLRRQEKCAGAIALYQKATSIDRRYPEAQLGLGECLAATGRFDEAMAAFDKGLNWGKEWEPRFRVARGRAYLARDSLREAGIAFTRARELAPNDPEIRRAVGEFYMTRGTWDLAVPELQAAVALDSTDLDAQGSLAKALFFSGKYDDALAAYQRLTTRAPEYAPAQLGIGDLLYRAGAADPRRFAEAREHLRRYVQLAPDDARGWSLLGRTLYRAGERDSALEALVRADSLGDRSKDLYNTLGLAYADRQEWDKALAAFQRGQPGPRELPALARAYAATGHPEQADSLLGHVAVADTTGRGRTYALTEKARLRYKDKDWGGAADLYGQALAIDPADGDAWFYQGLSYKQMGRNEEARAALRKAADLDPGKADRQFWLGVVDDALHRTGEAQQAFRRSVELEPSGDLAAKAYRQLGYYELLRKRWKSAIPLLERATQGDPADAQAWLWLAQGTQNAGHGKRAAQLYRRVLAIDPDNAEAQKGLRVLGGASSAGGSP